MDGNIGRLHCHYRLAAPASSAGVLVARLDRLARKPLITAYEAALDEALNDDPAVYVLRRVDCRLSLFLGNGASDVQITRRWGQRLAGAVLRAIADQGDSLVQFTDQADFAAHFIHDLLRGRAWQRWYYGAFAALRPFSTPAAVRTVLLDNTDHVPAILGNLHQTGVLEDVLHVLDESTLRSLWPQGPGVSELDLELARPFYAAALRLVDRLGLWARPRPGLELLQTYLAGRPPLASWRDPRELAVALRDMLRLLSRQGYLRQAVNIEEPAFLTRWESALAELDWLDVAWFETAVMELLSAPSGLPLRPTAHGPTPRQRELLADLLAALAETGLRLDPSQPESPANALRWYAALVARAPRWANDPAATAMIQRFLVAWAALVQARSAEDTIRWLRQGDVQRALGTLPRAAQGRVAGTFRFLVDLDQPGLALIKTLAGGEGHAPPAVRPGTETACAGVFLLLRAILDARLPWLVESAEYPPRRGELSPLSAVLIALGLRWAGEPGLVDGGIDAGLSLLAGLEDVPSVEALHEVWSNTGPEDDARFQEALLRVLAGQRLIHGSALHLYQVPVRGGASALVAGHQPAGPWPLGRLVEAPAEAARVLARWLELWEEATGRRGAVVPCDGSLADRLTPELVPMPEAELPGTSDDPDELAEAHRAGREALLGALGALDHGRLDIPEADLTLSLTAAALLRVWARWLRGFATSSVPYLLENFIRRPGRVYPDADVILVELEPRPLDLVIDMAGYTAELAQLPWLNQRSVRFVTDR